jgi:hypothetical protein
VTEARGADEREHGDHHAAEKVEDALALLLDAQGSPTHLLDGALGPALGLLHDTFVSRVEIDDGLDLAGRADQLGPDAPQGQLIAQLDEECHDTAVSGVYLRQIERERTERAQGVFANVAPDGRCIVHPEVS